MDQRINNVKAHQVVVHRFNLVNLVTGGAHPRNRVLLEQFKTGPENTPGDKKGRHAVLPRRANVASVDSGNPSRSHAEVFGRFSQSIFS